MRFEYKQIVFNLGLTLSQKKHDGAMELLNEAGRDGWEMVSAASMGDSHYMVYVFKRPLRGEF
ncbi:MAG: DUF4177 domain-containing protein [Defluviitaleaceae bacterium]|nr:DUF4177 domain-containing protein [Defluviitaleaceae bacterium]